eukprot:CAMPEP_0172823898 /NCGR_PEP_ID=MMETSP1075-20121228/17636_1 /TAXON_ID=2916 /ORGANISM="Ceratium fusus, Strain PA161109" /LENGTH=40 /DNA_ID= /DNA_START= /DNA_END= /DNA_ORIENTATION=
MNPSTPSTFCVGSPAAAPHSGRNAVLQSENVHGWMRGHHN